MKKVLAFLITLAVGILAGYFLARKTSEPDPAFWVAKAEYDKLAAATEASHAQDQAAMAMQNEVIAAQTAEISGLLAAAGKPSPAELEKDKQIATLEDHLAAYEAQGDLASALTAAKTENSAWAEKFSLAEDRHKAAIAELDSSWQVKFDAQVDISESWQRQYENERVLRIAAEGLAEDALRVVRAAKFERTAHDVEGLGVGVWSAVKHKDPLPLALYAAEKLAGKVKSLFHR
ncbi:MAG: hypothetical protein ABFD52_08900 [Acidobacteriota bacterium]